MHTVTKTPQSLAGDIGRMQRESAMVMATVASLADDELSKPTKCEGWTRAHLIAHLARGADAMTNLATWAVTGQETPAYESREKREWHEADPDAILDSIEICVLRLRRNPDSPGLQIIAGEGEEWIVGDGSYKIEGYYDELLPFLARGQVEEGLQYEGELPKLPPW
jgi:hypothetical protein